MKSAHIIVLFSISLLLTACPGTKYEDAGKKLHTNNMDLPDPKINYYRGIRFKLSKLFEDSYDTDFVINDNALTKIIYDLDLNFSVEKFDKNDAISFQFSFSDKTDLLNAVHDYYVFKRQKSLYEQFTSIKKPVPKEVGFNGVVQTIEGENYEGDEILTYFMATIEVYDNYYVFQLIGKKENMGYLYDDFISMLNSIEK